MGGKKKVLCKWKSKEIEKDIKSYSKLANNPKVICQKCGRAANHKKYVCKPVDIEH